MRYSDWPIAGVFLGTVLGGTYAMTNYFIIPGKETISPPETYQALTAIILAPLLGGALGTLAAYLAKSRRNNSP